MNICVILGMSVKILKVVILSVGTICRKGEVLHLAVGIRGITVQGSSDYRNMVVCTPISNVRVLLGRGVRNEKG